jgi:nicotinamidase-related amidase
VRYDASEAPPVLSRRSTVTSEAPRDSTVDHLLTPTNCALLMIDYQPTQIHTIRSADPQVIVNNIVRVAQIGVAYKLPIVLSTVNVSNGVNEPTIPELRDVLAGIEAIDRTTINAWEDVQFKRAVEATGRKKLVIAAIWTEVCLAFPVLDALREGFDAYPVVDAVGGTTIEAHRAGLERQYLAGARPTSVAQLACELQRDWARTATVPVFKDILTSIESGDTRQPIAARGH